MANSPGVRKYFLSTRRATSALAHVAPGPDRAGNHLAVIPGTWTGAR